MDSHTKEECFLSVKASLSRITRHINLQFLLVLCSLLFNWGFSRLGKNESHGFRLLQLELPSLLPERVSLAQTFLSCYSVKLTDYHLFLFCYARISYVQASTLKLGHTLSSFYSGDIVSLFPNLSLDLVYSPGSY